jgi:hypothetical protein
MTHDIRHEVSLCGVPIRIAQHCRSVADATIQTANREPLPIPMPHTLTPPNSNCKSFTARLLLRLFSYA